MVPDVSIRLHHPARRGHKPGKGSGDDMNQSTAEGGDSQKEKGPRQAV